jgi:hypothetical protein
MKNIRDTTLIAIFIILVAGAVAADLLFLNTQFGELKKCMRVIAKALTK